MNTNESENTFHNPSNLTSERYGAAEGWRLVTVDEMNCLPLDAEVTLPLVGGWDVSANRGRDGSKAYTYRTRTPLPAKSDKASPTPEEVAAARAWIRLQMWLAPKSAETDALYQILAGRRHGPESIYQTCTRILDAALTQVEKERDKLKAEVAAITEAHNAQAVAAESYGAMMAEGHVLQSRIRELEAQMAERMTWFNELRDASETLEAVLNQRLRMMQQDVEREKARVSSLQERADSMRGALEHYAFADYLTTEQQKLAYDLICAHPSTETKNENDAAASGTDAALSAQPAPTAQPEVVIYYTPQPDAVVTKRTEWRFPNSTRSSDAAWSRVVEADRCALGEKLSSFPDKPEFREPVQPAAQPEAEVTALRERVAQLEGAVRVLNTCYPAAINALPEEVAQVLQSVLSPKDTSTDTNLQ